MKLDYLRWTLLSLAAAALPYLLFRGVTPGRAAFFAVSALAWFGLSRLKTFSLDRDRFLDGKLGRRRIKDYPTN